MTAKMAIILNQSKNTILDVCCMTFIWKRIKIRRTMGMDAKYTTFYLISILRYDYISKQRPEMHGIWYSAQKTFES
jgi:hypothetical protein